ncbi:MAG TPA: DUF4136 domain-containing protein [Polyangiaceae bacterium]|nr:DUF4136 domain-containing protein [Polyangiaceae bacterium]
MKINAVLTIVGFALTLGLGCSKAPTSDIHTQAHVAPGLEKQPLRTFAWAGGLTIATKPDGLWNPPDFDVASETKFLIDQELRERGLSEVTESPDLVVAFLVVNDVKDLEKIEGKEGAKEVELNAVGQGALVIEIAQVSTERVVFLGAATAETQSKYTKDEMKARLAHAVDHILADFKPQTK